MEVTGIPQKAEYKNVQAFINSGSTKKIDISHSAGKSEETESKANVVETAHLGRNVDTYA